MERNYESNAFGSLLQPQSLSAATLYNGAAATAASGTGLDTTGSDGITIMLNCGTFTGNDTFDASVYASATDDSTAATLVTGATFAQVTTANHQTVYKGYVKAHAYSKYFWLKTVTAGSGSALVSATYAMDRNPKHPALARASLSFCIDGSV